MTIYFDNAATSFPKPEEVYRAQDDYLRAAANPGRGAYRLSLDSARRLFDIRMRLAAFLGIKDASRLVFTAGCTLALNMALKGFKWLDGDVVVTSALEHNSVMRPLKQLESQRGIRIISMPYIPGKMVDASQLDKTLKEARPRLCVFAHASNVTGDVLDLEAVAQVCRANHIPLMIDAAQAAGVRPADISRLAIALWCAPGHKGLLGPPGVGLLYVSPEISIDPLVAGGTGSASEQLSMPEVYPDHLESGTLPGPAIAGLGAGVDWLEKASYKKIAEHEAALARHFLNWAGRHERIAVFGPAATVEDRTGIVSFQVKGVTPDRVADLLDSKFGIAVRPGLHCAALAHKTLGTVATGLVRASFGPFNTEAEVDELCNSLRQIARETAGV